MEQSVIIVLSLAVLSLMVWPFAEGFYRGCFAIPDEAPDSQVRRAKIAWFVIASVGAIASSLIFGREPVRGIVPSKEAEDPCQRNHSQLIREYPALKAISERQVEELLEHELRGERLELHLKEKGLECQALIIRRSDDQYTECVVRLAEYEREMRLAHAEFMLSMAERHDAEWKKACNQVLRGELGVDGTAKRFATQGWASDGGGK